MIMQTLTPTQLRLSAWVLALSILPFIALPVTGVIGFVLTVPPGTQVPTFNQITPQQMAVIGIAWIAIHIVSFVAFSWGAMGVALLSNQLKATKVRLLAWFSQVSMLVSVLIIVAHTYLRISALGFAEATLGQSTNYQMSENLIYAYYLVALAATLPVSLAVSMTGWLKRVGLAVSVMSGILLLLTLIAPTLPPIVFIFLWVPLGIGLLRQQRS
jgi:hypothetical protein